MGGEDDEDGASDGPMRLSQGDASGGAIGEVFCSVAGSACCFAFASLSQKKRRTNVAVVGTGSTHAHESTSSGLVGLQSSAGGDDTTLDNGFGRRADDEGDKTPSSPDSPVDD